MHKVPRATLSARHAFGMKPAIVKACLRLGAGFGLALLCGCGGWKKVGDIAVVGDIVKAQGKALLLETTKWTVFGAVGGLVLAIAAFWVLRRIGAYHWKWKHAKWLRGLTLALTLVLCPVLLGTAGFFQGVVRSTDYLLHESQFAREVLPKLGESGADCIAYFHLRIPPVTPADSASSDESADKELEAFRAGNWELNAAEFLGRVNRVTDKAVNETVSKLKQSALERYPAWKEGMGEKALTWFLDTFGESFLNKRVRQRMDRIGLEDRWRSLVDGLRPEAARAGDPNTISRKELSAYLVREGLIPVIEQPIRALARQQQAAMLILLCLVVIIPAGCFRLAELLRARNARRRTAEHPS